ncbi:excinuclease ABC, C subunit [Halobacteroides halobius DSM 5150]|uniref:UvrABC system protein C n=1 Tax=Halobacteroides halobius (strain ATCC 35273 / DSM 5150 / MD-1) TaxID=748449 RepID=L0KD53_HALHC|nr:excinuclease ABC subunit UvrC [Halobacteroides halobius]AGB42018.1 excinuclease ABC, C subunit [Halobacteroides halobius DSM 5150]
MKLKQKVKNLPHEPGVYLMKGQRGQVIYVGKAKSLRNRVGSYFQDTKHQRFKTTVLVKRIADLDYIITDTEMEALILENNLIKKYNPKFNIQLKDDKTYPYIKVTVTTKYPRVYKTRVVKQDGARYFGPYTDPKAVNDMLDLIHDLFPLRTCKQDLTKEQGRACLNYHIDKCLGPCIEEINPQEYQKMIEQVLMILEGKEANLKQDLEAQMEVAAESLDFERAAQLRDQSKAIDKITQKQKVVTKDLVDRDIVALAQEEELICLQLLIVRNGRLIGKEDFIFTEVQDKQETLTSFLQQYYDTVYYIPEEILIDTKLEDQSLIAKWLSNEQESKVGIKLPKQGAKKELVEMAYRNARHNLKEHKLQTTLHSSHIGRGVKELKEELNLATAPYRIEGFDISTIQGQATVASLVVFENGVPKKSDYRRFKMKTLEGQDDFGAMQEVVERRYSRLIEKEKKFPDLILIDGGKGQLNAAVNILEKLNKSGQPIISLAKKKEEIFLPNREESILLPRKSDALYLVQRVRDEAHRFAVNYHRKLRSRRLTHSMLDDIPGVGTKKRQALLQHFGSLGKIKQASKEELVEVAGIGPQLAQQIKEYMKLNLRP